MALLGQSFATAPAISLQQQGWRCRNGGCQAATKRLQLLFTLAAWSAVLGLLPSAESSLHATGTFPLLASAPKLLSPRFRHASVSFSEAKSRWLVPPTANWTDSVLALAVIDQKLCASSWFQVPILSFSLLVSRLQQRYPDEVNATLHTLPALRSIVPNGVICAGGWPYRLLDAIASYSQDALMKFVSFTYEQPASTFDWFGLLLAVQRQPVMVFLHAGIASFKNYKGGVYGDPQCSRGLIDHSMTVVGFDLRGSKPHWLLVNSWGTEWGIQGYMKMQISGGQGICNIHAVPPVYPVLKLSPDPCSPINPCGSGTCTVDQSTQPGRALCDCPKGFVSANDSLGSETCAMVNVCDSFAFNPCRMGECTNDGAGSYTCICPPGMKAGMRADGSLTCVIGSRFFSPRSCSLYYMWNQGDSCGTIVHNFTIRLGALGRLNPWLNCARGARPGKQVCLRRGKLRDTPLCTKYHTARDKDTCRTIMRRHGVLPRRFFQLNPGLFCTNLFPRANRTDHVRIPSFGAQVCVRGPLMMSRLTPGRKLATAARCGMGRHIVKRGDFCAQIVAKYCGGSVARFQQLNRGFTCKNDNLFAGQELCTSIPG